MVRYLIFMSYIGTRYRGAAKQLGSERLIDLDTIQGAVEACLHNTLRPKSLKPPYISPSSRTDAGVHALCTTAHIDLHHPLGEIYDTESILRHSNLYFARCGHEIRLHNIYPVLDTFNARKNAKFREYFYRFAISKNVDEHRIPVSEMGRCWHVRGENLDIDALKRAIPLFLGRKNFETFAAKNRTNREIHYVRELMNLELIKTQGLMPNDPLAENYNFWQINVSARAFLYNQVRRIVGALIGIASGAITERDIKLMLQVPNVQYWNSKLTMAPPQGLYLKSVNYDKDELNNFIIKPQQVQDEQKIEKLVATC